MKALMRNNRASAVQKAARVQVDSKFQVPFESTRISTLDRFADEPEPTNDEQIVTHYLKHHP